MKLRHQIIFLKPGPPSVIVSSLTGRIGRIAWINSDPAGVTTWGNTPHWGRVFWWADRWGV